MFWERGSTDIRSAVAPSPLLSLFPGGVEQHGKTPCPRLSSGKQGCGEGGTGSSIQPLVSGDRPKEAVGKSSDFLLQARHWEWAKGWGEGGASLLPSWEGKKAVGRSPLHGPAASPLCSWSQFAEWREKQDKAPAYFSFQDL